VNANQRDHLIAQWQDGVEWASAMLTRVQRLEQSSPRNWADSVRRIVDHEATAGTVGLTPPPLYLVRQGTRAGTRRQADVAAVGPDRSGAA
jgi:hypothetical protein